MREALAVEEVLLLARERLRSNGVSFFACCQAAEGKAPLLTSPPRHNCLGALVIGVLVPAFMTTSVRVGIQIVEVAIRQSLEHVRKGLALRVFRFTPLRLGLVQRQHRPRARCCRLRPQSHDR